MFNFSREQNENRIVLLGLGLMGWCISGNNDYANLSINSLVSFLLILWNENPLIKMHLQPQKFKFQMNFTFSKSHKRPKEFFVKKNAEEKIKSIFRKSSLNRTNQNYPSPVNKKQREKLGSQLSNLQLNKLFYILNWSEKSLDLEIEAFFLCILSLNGTAQDIH